MSWELVSFLILGAVLVAGFAWYERSRPPAQVVALVAALAALAIAGRVAFAAFPNVKPTTDIVIFAGYALGGAPGFAVGALTALVSNLWFGQGPWTPWQMAGWGLCGMLGAALALGNRDVGRLTLAAVCGFAGIAYGALLNFSLMATYGGDLSWERFIVLEGRAVPFDAAHAVGNVVLALIAGPALIRMLVRFRERFEWSRRTDAPTRPRPPAAKPGLAGGGLVALLVALVAFGLLGALAPARAGAAGVNSAALWLVSQQNGDGGWGASPGNDSGSEITCWAMLGLEASSRNPLDVVSRRGKTPVDFLRANVDQLTSPGDLARTILALEGAGVDPRKFGGRNLVDGLLKRRRSNGSYEGWPNSTAFAVIALRAAGVSGGVEESVSWLRSVQNDDGGWGDVPNSPSTADGTGAVMQALSRGSKPMGRAVNYLRGVQRKGGGFSLGGNGVVNSQSTAWAIQGILAAGGDPGAYRRGGVSAPEYLEARQASDGHYRYSRNSDQTPVWVTGEALVATSNSYFPISAPAREPKSEIAPATSLPGTSGGIPPSTVSPSPSLESPAVPPGTSSSGGSGSLPERFAPQGPGGSEAPAETDTPAGQAKEGSGSSAAEASAAADEGEPSGGSSGGGSSGSPVSGAILTGLLAGCLLFGGAWGARTVWMRWRYGV
jgi:energy-coupling factor transport system substrate-specific component